MWMWNECECESGPSTLDLEVSHPLSTSNPDLDLDLDLRAGPEAGPSTQGTSTWEWMTIHDHLRKSQSASQLSHLILIEVLKLGPRPRTSIWSWTRPSIWSWT
jgi:hypothetical protein